MTSARNDPASRLRTNVTRVHAISLFVITIAATTGSTLGWKGHGPLEVLASRPFGYQLVSRPVPGVFLLLMFLLALVCLIGATRWPSRVWNAHKLPAHGLHRRAARARRPDSAGKLRAALESLGGPLFTKRATPR
jgi:hypothetical protein